MADLPGGIRDQQIENLFRSERVRLEPHARSLTMRTTIRALLVLSAVFVAGCERGGGLSDIAPHSTDEVLRIGVVGGPVELQFHRVAAARFTPEGDLLIGDASTGEVRSFTSAGEWIGSFGARGQGPGEHQDISGIWISGDTVWVGDNLALRVTQWLRDGRLIETARIPSVPGGGRGWVQGRTTDGAFVVSSAAPGETDRFHDRPDSVDVFLWDGGIRVSGHRLGRYFFRLSHMYENESGPGFTWYPAPLRSVGVVAAAGGEVVVLEGNAGRVVRVTSKSEEWIELPVSQRLPVTAEHKQEYEEVWVGSVSEQWRPRLQHALQGMTFPDTLPVASDLVVGGDRSIWVREFSIGPREAEFWWWFAPGEDHARRVVLPGSFTLMDAMGDLVLGVDQDSLNVENVVIRALMRP